jgi:hypothetical protein
MEDKAKKEKEVVCCCSLFLPSPTLKECLMQHQ